MLLVCASQFMSWIGQPSQNGPRTDQARSRSPSTMKPPFRVPTSSATVFVTVTSVSCSREDTDGRARRFVCVTDLQAFARSGLWTGPASDGKVNFMPVEDQRRGTMNDQPQSMRDRFNQIASTLTNTLGSPFALALAALLIVVWLVSGPLFNFSDTWQLAINTGTTIVTFLMVFVIQASQNRDSKALHLKLDEIIRALDEARNDFVTVEQASEEEMKEREDEMARVAERVAHEAGHPEPRRIAAEAARSMTRSSRRRSRTRKQPDEKNAGAKR